MIFFEHTGQIWPQVLAAEDCIHLQYLLAGMQDSRGKSCDSRSRESTLCLELMGRIRPQALAADDCVHLQYLLAGKQDPRGKSWVSGSGESVTSP